jgi:hypothetical protein
LRLQPYLSVCEIELSGQPKNQQENRIMSLILPEQIDEIEDVELFKSFNKCLKKPIPIAAVQMDKKFRVKALEGDYKQGKPGDYLMCGVMGELYICDKEIFEKTYDWL